MMSAMYDEDDVFNRSPPLEAIKPDYGESKSLPPFVPTCQKDAETAGATRKPNHREPRIATHEGDRVLMGYLAPQHPEMAVTARNGPLEPGNFKNYRPPDFDPRSNKKPNPTRDDPRPKERLIIIEPPSGPASEPKIEKKPPLITTSAPSKPVEPAVDVKSELAPRERPPSISDSNRRFSPELPPLQTSPGLGVNPRISSSSLNPIQRSPGSCLKNSPDGSHQKLPSIQKALSALTDFGPSPVNTMPSPYPFTSCPGSTTSGNDSPFDRPFPGKFPIPASPFSHFSPVSMKDASTNPSPASHSSFWPGTPHCEMLSAQTPYEASPMTAKSPATSYPTPTEHVGAGMSDRHSLAASTPQANGGPVGSYKCAHPGCTAAPFQTQYLLNSHANVHSQERPHFCPVEGCSRAVGGKGFKRKNEMMRHGLVHNSPGYVCPFCPDQQHKYPRPDNLQRHVRVHHVDKNKDDPILRHVLAQRPLGSARGRKRRMNNT
ncbi:hypothetical protein N7457_002941 [Penicillium paradoxum]|uniref:uncharacterized protein n=1 Tax=Penicillium paradoxum TaxID=176176 RepID=UPI0025486A84|nr:uncharacterized protein N7457_002941 [Penicillium paradoxum]KAJ5787951.1 hypothetical protein N7457_002941 [Penicillium paradoxum]